MRFGNFVEGGRIRGVIAREAERRGSPQRERETRVAGRADRKAVKAAKEGSGRLGARIHPHRPLR